MIDLTKPIRHKRCDVGGHLSIRLTVTDGFQGRVVSMEELERDYENIPEPRKPREWCLEWSPDGKRKWVIQGGFRESDNSVRVIEWPEGAPLPEWPE